MRIINDKTKLLSERWPRVTALDNKLVEYVKPIVADVASRGDNAIREYTEKFDKVKIKNFRITSEELNEAYKNVSKKEIEALKESKRRLEVVERNRLTLNNFKVELEGVKISCNLRPIEEVGCYVPGGKASYPSSVIMNVVPAKVAGVQRVVVCTPPKKDGSIDPMTLVACDICQVAEIYKIGGIQAIAALAYGTETIKKVDKITGPGNRYVTAAKTIVSETVSIDKPAGPSEILILADDTANPNYIAADIISQAEHGFGGVSGLVTTSEQFADKVIQLIEENTLDQELDSIVSNVLSESGFVYIVKTINEAIEFVNLFGPEHLEIMTKSPEIVVDKIINSGLILIGDFTPVSSTDYCMGVNHVLPTKGYSKVSSGLTILDYMKPVSIVEASKTGLELVRDKIVALAESEGLFNHKKAVEVRFK
jgi:histidinol dehydrogenase